MFISFQSPAKTRLLRSKYERGFTLLELMVTVAIVGVLASVAIPVYKTQVQTARRTDLIEALVIAQEELENCKSTQQSRTYDGCLTMKGGFVDTPAKHYNIEIELLPNGGPATSYKLTATPVAGSPQADDKACSQFIVNSIGERTATNDRCWGSK